jgi:hypothetical protein
MAGDPYRHHPQGNNRCARAREAGVEAEFIQDDLTALRTAGVGRGYRLLLDFGTIHGLNDIQREAVSRAING